MTPKERIAELVMARGRQVKLGVYSTVPFSTEESAAEVAEWFRADILAIVDAAVASALSAGGVPGVELTTEQVEEIRGRARAATAGPWEQTGDPSHRNMVRCAAPAHSFTGVSFSHPEDAAFTAHARQDVPTLLSDRLALFAAIRDMALDDKLAVYQRGVAAGVATMKNLAVEAADAVAADAAAQVSDRIADIDNVHWKTRARAATDVARRIAALESAP